MSPSPTDLEPDHRDARMMLRVVGPTLTGVGILLSVVGLWSFFSAFGTFEPPRYFWAVLVGFPIIAIGASLTNYGYMGAILRYQAEEATPVARKTFDTLARGASGSVETIARAMARGVRSRGGGRAEADALCEKCHTLNEPDSKFCHQCGTPLSRRACAGCGSALATGARFCGQCGKVVG